MQGLRGLSTHSRRLGAVSVLSCTLETLAPSGSRGRPCREPRHWHAGLAVALGHRHRLLLLHLGRPASLTRGPRLLQAIARDSIVPFLQAAPSCVRLPPARKPASEAWGLPQAQAGDVGPPPQPWPPHPSLCSRLALCLPQALGFPSRTACGKRRWGSKLPPRSPRSPWGPPRLCPQPALAGAPGSALWPLLAVAVWGPSWRCSPEASFGDDAVSLPPART